MTAKAKRRLILVGAAIFFLCVAWLWLGPPTPESRFRALFADLSIGVPDYQRFDSFAQPLDAIKGDFFSLEFEQSEPQFRQFAAKLGASHARLVSSTGIWVRANCRIDPEYPWMLEVRADVAASPDKCYKIHIEGRQPYN
jgi:hypothetical protein